MQMMQLIFSQANDKTSELGKYEQLLSKQGPGGGDWSATNLDCNCASQSIQILQEFAHTNRVPGVPILLSKCRVWREIIQNTRPILLRGFALQLGLCRAIHRHGSSSLHETGFCVPQCSGHGRMVLPWPQSERLLLWWHCDYQFLVQKFGHWTNPQFWDHKPSAARMSNPSLYIACTWKAMMDNNPLW